MITVSNLGLEFSGAKLFSGVDLKFVPGNCYGIIGANGAGKSTFLKLLAGEIEPSAGSIEIAKGLRMSVLKQDQFAFDGFSVSDTVIMGNARLYEIIGEKERLYEKADFTDQDGLLLADLEGEFAKMGGWDADTWVASLLRGLGLRDIDPSQPMRMLKGSEKVKVLLAQALFGNPDIMLLDEPTNNLDIQSIAWLEDFLIDYPGTVIVVSHDRHFLNNVCTHIVDIDYTQIKMYVGNYEFWYESSQLMQKIRREQNKKTDEKIKELQGFVARFSANKSKSKQATSRKKLIEKLSYEELPDSMRRYPFVGFKADRELGKDVLTVTNICKTVDGIKVLDGVTFTVGRTDKIAFVGENEAASTTLFKIITGALEPDEGSYKWGVSASYSYFPKDNAEFFDGNDMTILQWLKQYSKDDTDTYLRGFLGKMLFSGDDVFKQVKVLSGGERVRCMLSRMMMFGSNVLLLDQPTNHLDLESITAVNNGLADFKGVVLFASHDHQIIQTTANRIIEFLPGGGMADERMTYDEYIELRKGQEAKE